MYLDQPIHFRVLQSKSGWFRLSGRQLSAGMLDKIRPVTQRVGMDRMAPQAAGTLHGRGQVVRNTTVQIHAGVLANNAAADLRKMAPCGTLAVCWRRGSKKRLSLAPKRLNCCHIPAP